MAKKDRYLLPSGRHDLIMLYDASNPPDDILKLQEQGIPIGALGRNDKPLRHGFVKKNLKERVAPRASAIHNTHSIYNPHSKNYSPDMRLIRQVNSFASDMSHILLTCD